MREDTSTVDMYELNDKIDQNLKDIEKLIPDDPIAKATNAKVGTDEHIAQNELVDSVKETNSTMRVNRVLKLLKNVGWVGLAIASVIKFIGIVYDVNFHLPFLQEVITIQGVATLGFFITVIIIIMTHVTSDGIVNNKWKHTPRFVLIWLAMLGLSASFYFDYRAINNYTNVVVAKIKQEKIKNSADTDGIAVKSVDSGIELLKNNLAMYQKQLESNQERLTRINEQKNSINESIERVKSLKEKTRSNRTIRKLNQNIYTSRKQLDQLSADETKILTANKELMAQLSSIQDKIDERSDKKSELIKEVDNKMSDDQFNRMIFLFVLVIFIELTSFGGLLADFLGNKNIETDLKAKIDELNNNTNVMSVIRGHLTAQEVRQAREFDRELSMRGAVADVHALSSIANMHRQAQNVKSFTNATHKIGEATNEVVTLAVEGVASTIKAKLAESRVQKLYEILEEPKNEQ